MSVPKRLPVTLAMATTGTRQITVIDEVVLDGKPVRLRSHQAIAPVCESLHTGTDHSRNPPDYGSHKTPKRSVGLLIASSHSILNQNMSSTAGKAFCRPRGLGYEICSRARSSGYWRGVQCHDPRELCWCVFC